MTEYTYDTIPEDIAIPETEIREEVLKRLMELVQDNTSPAIVRVAAGHIYDRKGYADVKELGTGDSYAASEDVLLQVTIRVPGDTGQDLRDPAMEANAAREERKLQAQRDEIDKQIEAARALEQELIAQRAAI